MASKICRIHSKERASLSYAHLQANTSIYKERENLKCLSFSRCTCVCVRTEGLKFCIGSFLVTWHCA